MTRYCINCGGPLTRNKRERVVHAQWWRRLTCLTPRALGPVLRNDNES